MTAPRAVAGSIPREPRPPQGAGPLETPIPPAPLVWDPKQPKRKSGRPTLFEAKPEAWPRLIWALRQGNTFQAAAGFAGISRSVLAKCMQRGRAAQRSGHRGPWKDFMDAVDESLAVAEVMHVGHIALAARAGTWKAAAFLLQTRNPKRWAPASRVAHTDSSFKGDAVFEMVLPNTRPVGAPANPKALPAGDEPAAAEADDEVAAFLEDEGV